MPGAMLDVWLIALQFDGADTMTESWFSMLLNRFDPGCSGHISMEARL